MTNKSGRGRPPRGDQRRAIVEAAADVLAARGRQAATVKAIARAAGVAPGLVHYYFESKEDLLLAILRAASDRYIAEMTALASHVPAERLAEVALDEPRQRVTRQPEWYAARYDLFALGLRDPALAPGVAELLANGRRGIGKVARQALPEQSVDPDALAAVLLACFDGLALQRLLDPTFDLTGAYAALRALLGTTPSKK